MAPARHQNFDDDGGYGKSRKRPFRRNQPTPYVRPPSAIRNPPGLATNSGWVSRLLDPAQRLITSGAKKLFASFLSKRLNPAPLSPEPPERAETSHSDKQDGDINSGLAETRIAPISGGGHATKSSDGGGITELELLLKQKTFTRSEIEQLTSLLQSRTVDPLVGDDEIKSDDSLSRKVFLKDKEQGFTVTAAENCMTERSIVSTPAVISKVVNEDVATPAEVAKSYMGNRLSKRSPFDGSMHGQSSRKDSTLVNSYSIPSNSSVMVAVPRPSTHVGFQENGFATPRSVGKSAIYSMVRSPYSRVHSTTPFQGTLSRTDTFALQSPSSLTSMSNGISLTKGAQKRRSSPIGNDVGPFSTIRRVRQKSNLLPVSGTVRNQGGGLSSGSTPYQSSAEKSPSVGKSSINNGDNSQSGSVLGHVPSKSSETASKILRQLDALVTSKEKPPSKLSPSMLNEKGRRSLEKIDSSKFLETIQDNGLVHNATLPSAHENKHKQDKGSENGPSQSRALFDKSASGSSGVAKNRLNTNIATTVKSTFSPSSSTIVVQPNRFKKHGFQMRAPEDYLEIDDDDHSKDDGPVSNDGEKKPNTSLANNVTSSAEISRPAFSLINSSGSAFQHKQVGTAVASTGAEKTSDNTISLPALSSTLTVTETCSSKTSDKPSSLNDSNVPASVSRLSDKVFSQKEPNRALPVSSSNIKTAEKVPAFSFPSSPQVGVSFSGSNIDASSDQNHGSLNSSITKAPVFSSHSVKNPEVEKAQNKSRPLSKSSEIESKGLPASSSTSSASTFIFGNTANASSINNGNPPQASTSGFPTPPLFSNDIARQNLSSSSDSTLVNGSASATLSKLGGADTSGNSNLFMATSVPSFVPVFKFGSSVVSSTSASLSDTTTTVSDSVKETVKETSPGSLSSFPGIKSSESNVVSDLSKIKSSENGVSGVTPASPSTVSNIFGSNSSTGNGVFSSSTSASTGFAQNSNLFNDAAQTAEAQTQLNNSTQSIPVQFGSSTLKPSVGSIASEPFSSGVSPFNSSGSATAPATSLSSGATSGFSFGSSSLQGTTASFSSGTTTNVFNSGLSAPKSSLFGSSFNSSHSLSPSSGFMFGLTSTSNSAASSLPVVFGSSLNSSSSSSSSSGFVFGAASASGSAASSLPMVFGSTTSASPGSTFSFSSPAGTTQQSMFGNSSPSFAFGSSPSGNNDQMNMEDSMAEDTVHMSTPAAPVFNQPATSPSSSGFIFGSSTPPVSNPFGVVAPASTTPFQFASHPNLAAPSNPSPFQASGSLEFNAGGSFSLGAVGADKSNRKIIKVKRGPRRR